MEFERASSGLTGLDRVLDDLRLGDNVVWQVDDIADYRHFARAFAAAALKSHKKLVYFRFGRHSPLIDPAPGVRLEPVNAARGFEAFSAAIRSVITAEGEGVYYVFDCLSELLSEWSTDLMIGNFFLVTCPYLFHLKTIAYFAVLRDHHSYQTIARIRDTTQILLDLYHDDRFYIHPLKVWKRYSPTMFLPHVAPDGSDVFVPLTTSADAVQLFASRKPRGGLSHPARRLDYWDHLFIQAAETIQDSAGDSRTLAKRRQYLDKLLKMMISRDEMILTLARRFLNINDLLKIKDRLIGSGFIGGKAVGLILARAILAASTKRDWNMLLEPHDSFYIGSDVYYTYLVENSCWQLRQEQKLPENYYNTATILQEKLETGQFPEIIRDQFLEILEYFGQSPIIVRSSSLLEDSFGNAFAGKYASVFCTNQGNLTERYDRFIQAVRQVYASTMNRDALAYRAQRGLANCDEQMALLVQRVSGGHHGEYFFPDLAGVALSHNLYVWREEMQPEAGMLRLVLGLGTRAVDRVDDDYARFVALDHPLLRTETSSEEIRTFSQHGMDLLNLDLNQPETISIQDLINRNLIGQLPLFATPDISDDCFPDLGFPSRPWVFNFDPLLGETPFPRVMQELLQTLQEAYGHPVDTEFTVNFRSSRDFSINPEENPSNGISGEKNENPASPSIRLPQEAPPERMQTNFYINLLQCRPLQVRCNQQPVALPDYIPGERVILESHGHFMGGNQELQIERFIYVVPQMYTGLSISDQYQVARVIGKLNRMIPPQDESPTVLLGPGRWGTSTPSLGIPVSFAEINHFAVLGELAFQTGISTGGRQAGMIPELSYGTHFFQDLVETGIFYVALNEAVEGTRVNHEFFMNHPSQLLRWLADAERWRSIIRVVEFSAAKTGLGRNEILRLHADVSRNKMICWVES
ncbi:MAG TPA: PEP/pyruvate-binding domain-containing protein [Bacillota bacterium]